MHKTRTPWLARLVKGVALGFVLVVVGPYIWGPIYRFPEPTRFGGLAFFNPYAHVTGAWQRANLHAHGRAWVGLTNGQQTDEEVVRRYRNLGYGVPGVSDYQRIAAHYGIETMPIYEHGYNIGKRHQLAIGARSVQWFDFLLWQSLSQEQYVIDRVKATADLVALAHPATRDAYTTDDLQRLTAYDLIEVVNGPFAVEDAWDAALSTGHPVWALANDDTHDLADSRRTAAGWNMVDAVSTSTSDIVGALKAGRTYAVLRTGAIESANVTMLNRVDFSDDTLTVSVNGAESTFTFVGQNGAIRKTVKNALSASYAMAANDTYIRTVITSPQTVLYLNPVLRYNGKSLPKPAASVDAATTWAIRGGTALGVAVIWLAYSRRRKAQQPLSRAVLADAKRNIA